MRLISEDKSRMVDDEPALAIAAYALSNEGEQFRGRHVGIFEHEADARSWIETGEPKPKRILVRRVR